MYVKNEVRMRKKCKRNTGRYKLEHDMYAKYKCFIETCLTFLFTSTSILDLLNVKEIAIF